MLHRLRTTWMAGGSGMLLVLALSGAVAAASIVAAVTAPTVPTAPVVADTSQTFVDTNGNGIDDRCEAGVVVADPSAAASAEAAADLNGDGTISVSEAAQSGRVGGKNCNHGGYVSGVAHASACGEATSSADPSTVPSVDPSASSDTSGSAAPCTPHASEAPDTADTTPPVCTPVVAPSAAPSAAPSGAPVVDESPNTHGKTVSAVAQSDAIGGKNCNHGGAVSAAAKDHTARDARKAARDALRAARFLEKHGKNHAD